MSIETSAGAFKLTSFCGGPRWVTIEKGDKEIRIHPNELHDLVYAAQRHIDLIKQEEQEELRR